LLIQLRVNSRLTAILGLVAVADSEDLNSQNLSDSLLGSYHEGSECLSPEGLGHRGKS
jgi:hypothetical protein